MFRIVFFLSFLVVVSVAYPQPQASLSEKFDNIDVDKILNNEESYQKYFKCLANKGPCTPDGAALKRLIPDVLKTRCAKCTDKQKNGALKVVIFMMANKRSDLDVLASIYDPEGAYKRMYADIIMKRLGNGK